MLAEYLVQAKVVSRTRAVWLTGICAAVAVATVNDVELRMAGLQQRQQKLDQMAIQMQDLCSTLDETSAELQVHLLLSPYRMGIAVLCINIAATGGFES